MARQITIITPENIPLTLEPAGIATRTGALCIDILVQVSIALVLVIITAILTSVLSIGGWESFGSIVAIIGSFLLLFGYFLLFETIWNGQTPGKRVFGLRVVRDGGYPISFYASAIRNLLRVIDFLPMSYAAGALSVFFSPQYKRLGDIVAGTIVIKERPTDPAAAFRTGPVGSAPGTLPDSVRNPYDVLSPEELSLLRRYVQRRFEMTPDDAERLAYRLIVPLIDRLNVTFTPNVPPRYADLAAVLVRTADQRESEMYDGKPSRG